MRFLILLASLFAVAAHAADDFTGSWQNRKDGFYTLGFALRKDGRGIYATAVNQVILRWERTDTGVLLKIPGEKQATEIRLTYDAAAKTFGYDKPSGERETFRQISTVEPPDAEAQMEERQRKEQQNRPKFTEHKEEFSSRDALLKAIQTWAERTTPDARGLTAFVRASDSSWRCSLRNFSGSYFVRLPLVDKTSDKLTPGLVYALARSTTAPDLPTRFSLPKPQADAFRKWLTEHGIAFAEDASEARGPWQIEGYRTSIDANPKSDRAAFLSVTRYLIDELFRETKSSYFFSTYEPNDG